MFIFILFISIISPLNGETFNYTKYPDYYSEDFDVVDKSDMLNTITSYYDSAWNEIDNWEEAVYYEKLFFNKKNNLWTVLKYYKSGVLQMRGSYATPKKVTKQGHFDYYYENDLLENEGNFLNGKEDGNWSHCDKQGKISKEINYKDGKFNGELICYWNNGLLKRKDIYKDNELVKGEVWDSTGIKEDYYNYLTKPEFCGGNEVLLLFLKNKVKYPPKALRKGIMGKVVVGFIIEKDGQVSNIHILQGVHELLDAEAVRVVSIMPNWNPGNIEGKPIRVSYQIPINFSCK